MKNEKNDNKYPLNYCNSTNTNSIEIKNRQNTVRLVTYVLWENYHYSRRKQTRLLCVCTRLLILYFVPNNALYNINGFQTPKVIKLFFSRCINPVRNAIVSRPTRNLIPTDWFCFICIEQHTRIKTIQIVQSKKFVICWAVLILIYPNC